MSKKKPPQFNQSQTEKRSTSSGGDGYTEMTERVEVAGFWIPESGPVHGKLVDAYQYIQKSGKGKGNVGTMFVLDLAEPCGARVKAEGGIQVDQLDARELCGVIGSVGLRQLVSLGGCFVRIERQGKKLLGNGNEMWAYKVSYKAPKSGPRKLDVRPPFQAAEPPAAPSNGATREPGDLDADDLPF